MLAFPALVAVIAIGSFWGHQLWKITLVIGVFSAPFIFRVIRASTLSYATRDFVMAAKALGASDRRILAREILPNILPTVVSFGLIAVATIIVLEGTLAFLGLSVPPPTPSWGNMLNEGSSLLPGGKGQNNPWLVIFPAAAMFSLLFTLNVVADKLRSYFDVTEVSCEPSGRTGATPLLASTTSTSRFATPQGELRAVQGVSLTLEQGKTLGIVGESGSGKTVLSRAIMGLLPRQSATQTGSVRYEGQEILNAPQRGAAPALGHPDRHGLPGPDDLAQPGPAHRPPDHRDRSSSISSWAGTRPRRRRSPCSCRWASPRRSSATTPTRTSSPAACASG